MQLHFDIVRLKNAGAVAETTKYGDGLRLGDLHFSINNGEGLISLGSELLFARIPPGAEELLREITDYENVKTADRHEGEYAYKTARAVVASINNERGQRSHYHVRYCGPKLQDIQKLHQLFCGGFIWPVGDYEAPMVPPSCRELRQLLREAWSIVRRDMSLRLRRA